MIVLLRPKYLQIVFADNRDWPFAGRWGAE
jgi:hypothetical protein